MFDLKVLFIQDYVYSGFVLGMFPCILYCNHLVRQDMDVNETSFTPRNTLKRNRYICTGTGTFVDIKFSAHDASME